MFGRYLLVQRLSRGGMGEIFLAKHGLAGFEKLAVIKKVLPNLSADSQFISRFVDEAQVAIKLQHVNVAQVFEVGRVGDEYFLALEYVEGRDLRRTLTLLGQRKQRMPVDLALFVGRELANGLAYAHRRTSNDGISLNLVHCDISPPNVLVSFEGETKVIDFGIAKSRLRGTATDPKMGFGKFGYMAPEQLIRGGQVDYRTDIYAAGVVLFELLTGTRLYEAGDQPDYRALARKVSRGEYPLPSEIDPVLAPYDDLVATALRPKQEDRYQSAAELRDAIQQCLVAVNPTISTDQLGGFMRELFADEMLAQRELHERVAKTHLADFKEQLTTQSVSTISFALANLPLVAPAEGAPVAPPEPRRRSVTQGPITTPASADPRDARNARDANARDQGIAVPPGPDAAALAPRGTDEEISHLGTADLSLADGTGAVDPIVVPRRRKGLVIASAAAAFLVCGLVISWAMSRGGESSGSRGTKVAQGGAGGGVAAIDNGSAAPNAVAVANSGASPGANPDITVEPILDPNAPGAPNTANTVGSAGAVANATGSAGSVVAPQTGNATVDDPNVSIEPVPTHPSGAHPTHPSDPHHGTHELHSKPAHEHPTEAAALTREVIAGRFSATMREYTGYKAKFGMRLDGDWGDLATFMNFHLKADNLDEAARKIDAFRAKMHEPQ